MIFTDDNRMFTNELYLKEGETGLFKCRSHYSVQWRVSDSPILPPNAVQSRYWLAIVNVTIKDAVTYTCSGVVNEYGGMFIARGKVILIGKSKIELLKF